MPALALTLMLDVSGAAEAPSVRHRVDCPDSPATIETERPQEVAIACQGVGDAYGFLVPVGAKAPERVLVELVSALPEGLRGDAVGCYATQSHRILVLNYENFAGRGRWFGVPIDLALYRSVVAHEVAHAIVGCHLGERKLASAAHEYVAYVTMFATMPAALRTKALANMPGEGFDLATQINSMVYGFDPMAFGADSYRHWIRQRDGAEFLRRVMAGEAITEVELD
jgi:hypothetical protein